jgi:hypothetical protein
MKILTILRATGNGKTMEISDVNSINLEKPEIATPVHTWPE